MFVADALADPVAGVMAAVAALHALAGGGGMMVDVALREAAAWMAALMEDWLPARAAGITARSGANVRPRGDACHPRAAARSHRVRDDRSPSGRMPAVTATVQARTGLRADDTSDLS